MRRGPHLIISSEAEGLHEHGLYYYAMGIAQGFVPKTRRHSENALDLLRELSAARKKSFPVRELVQQAGSVNAYLDNLLRRAED